MRENIILKCTECGEENYINTRIDYEGKDFIIRKYANKLLYCQ